MADLAFRWFGGTRPRPESQRPSALQEFVERVNRETNGPTPALTDLYREFTDVCFRSRAPRNHKRL